MGDFVIANDKRDNTHIVQNIIANCIRTNKFIGPINGSTVIINGSTVIINSSTIVINATDSLCLNASNEICFNSSKIIINGSLIINPQLQHGVQVNNPASGVHGVVGNIVGTSDSQVLTNKTMDYNNNTFLNFPFSQNATAYSTTQIGGIVPNSSAVIPLNSLLASSPFVSLSGSSLLFNSSGLATITFSVCAGQDASINPAIVFVIKAQIDTGSGFADILGSSRVYIIDITTVLGLVQTACCSFSTLVNTGDLIRFAIINTSLSSGNARCGFAVGTSLTAAISFN